MSDSSDDFFSSFDSNRAARGGPPPPGAPGSASSLLTNRGGAGRGPPPGPPPAGARPSVRPIGGVSQATSLRRPGSGGPPPTARPSTTGYVGASTAAPQQQQQPSYYGQSNVNASKPPTPVSYAQQPQQSFTSQQSVPASTPVVSSNNNNDSFDSDWYSPTQEPKPTFQNPISQPQQQQPAPVMFQPQQQPSNSMPTQYGGGGYGGYGIQQQQPQQYYGQPQQQQHQQPVAAFVGTGSLDGSGGGVNNAPAPSFGGSMFVPNVMIPSSAGAMDGGTMDTSNNLPPPVGAYNDLDDFSNEPPLLEELGVNVEHIIMKTKAVVIPFRRFAGKHSALLDPAMIVEDADLAGPLAFALLLGGELMLAGKLQFGYIYGFGMFGCLSITLVLNLMTPGDTAISFWTVTSILGYALLPVNLLAAIKLFLLNLAGFLKLTQFLALLTVVWSTTASTRLLEVGCGMEAQRYLLAYPIALIYSAFVLITLF